MGWRGALSIAGTLIVIAVAIVNIAVPMAPPARRPLVEPTAQIRLAAPVVTLTPETISEAPGRFHSPPPASTVTPAADPWAPPSDGDDIIYARAGYLESVYDGESRDTTWARVNEQQISEAWTLASASAGADARLEAVSCRRTLCELHFAFAHPGVRDSVLTALLHEEPFRSQPGVNAAFLPHEEGADYRVLMHAAREGQPLPF